MPATDTTDFEREFEELVRELRALPTAAPASVREGVRALGEPAPRRRLPAVPWCRSLVVLAPVCVLGLVVAAVVHGLVSSGAKKQTLALESHTARAGAHAAPSPPVFGAAIQPPFDSLLVPPNAARHQDYQAWLRLRVKDLDELTRRTNEAMQA